MVDLGTQALTPRAEARVALDLRRRTVITWACAILCLNQLLSAVTETPSASLEQPVSDLAAVGVFQLMAWYAIFRLLASRDPPRVARLGDILVVAALCCLIFIPSPRMIWVAAFGVGVYASLFNQDDSRQRAAGVVLIALSVQEFWGRFFFNLVAFPLLRAETAVVGTLLQALRPGTVWEGNVITGPNGHGIVVYDACSSFHNLSLAALCWVTVRSLQDRGWQVRDFVTGGVVAATMVLFNVTRLSLMGWNEDLYLYWHEGAGAQIFTVSASTAILLISLYGSRLEKQAG